MAPTPRGSLTVGVELICCTVRWRERLSFLRQYRQQAVSTGAVQPSSRYLAHAMTEPLRGAAAPRRIVEMGPGTGAVTRAIAGAMTPIDDLDCFEINPRFAEFLHERVATRPEYAHVAARIRVHCAPAQDAPTDPPADFVICSVPLNNLPAETAAQIMDHGLRILSPGGWFSYFEYPLLPRVRRAFVGPAERGRIDAVRDAKRARSGDGYSCLVVRNVPPARAVHIPRPPTLD